MFDHFRVTADGPLYLQITNFIKELIAGGALHDGVRLPSTRELGQVMNVSRNTVVQAYQELERTELIRIVRGQGAYVTATGDKPVHRPKLDWEQRINGYAKAASELKSHTAEYPWREGFISFNSIAPDERIFDLDDLKRAFLNRVGFEGEKLLNYGEVRGYRPLIDYLQRYLEMKGVNFEGKEILITNGFTESFNLVLAALTNPGDQIICENPTHNLALNIMRLGGLAIAGIPVGEDGIAVAALEQALAGGGVKLGFLIPSYHNPTGLVMPAQKRLEVLSCFERYRVPLVEEGFNEELRFSGSHVSPLLALARDGNGVIHLGSLSKILFPGLRIGWIIGDARLIHYLESVKFFRNIYASLLDQAILCEYLQHGRFQTYLRRAKAHYKARYEHALRLVEHYLPYRRVWSSGGLHIFLELQGIDTRQLLDYCYQRKVLFTPGDIFYTDGAGRNTLRLSISRLSPSQMEQGLAIIGDGIRELRSSSGPGRDD
jgi:DNA-binding transcriptional MocR family regulator